MRTGFKKLLSVSGWLHSETKIILKMTRKGKRKRLEKHEKTLFKRIDEK
jgi:hypothetical protein